MTNTIQTIAMARTDGEGAAASYIKEFGVEAARAYAHQLMVENQAPSPAMYGYIDGFSNAAATA